MPALADLADPRAAAFEVGLKKVMLSLAHQVVRDGEGATKFVSVHVSGAENDNAARTVGLAIANSPLVKTAVAGEDPNWGRVVMAVGKSGERADRDLLSISFGDILVAENGWVAESYTEDAGAAYMKNPEITINVVRSDPRLHHDQCGLPLLMIVLVSAVALVDRDGRVLLAQRPEGKSMAGLWEFPGGKVEDGETPEAALIRELHEELGIETWSSCLAPITFASHTYNDFHLLMPLFVCRKWEGVAQAKEHQALKWVKTRDMGGYAMPAADIPLVAALRDLL